jgi:hypothetical protein
MKKINHDFSFAFNKYRLKSQFGTLSQFGEALAKEGYAYEDSIFSRWKKGTRVPSNRHLLLIILKVFVKHNGITHEDHANELLVAANQAVLNRYERQSIFENQYSFSTTNSENFNEDQALFLAENILGVPFSLINHLKIKTIYQKTKSTPIKYISLIREIKSYPQKIDSIIFQLQISGMILSDNYSSSHYSISKKTNNLSYLLTKNPPYFYGGFLLS